MATNLFVIANTKQLRTGGSFRILLPFFQISWAVGVLNSAIFNSFHSRVEFGTILEGLRNFREGVEPPQTPSVRHCPQQHYVQNFYTQFHTNRTVNVERMGRNICTVARKVCLSTTTVLTKVTSAQCHCVERSVRNYIQIRNKQDRQCTYDVTMRRFRSTIVVTQEQ